MLELRAAGYGLEEIAERMRLSTSCVFVNCRRLGQALAERAGIEPDQKKRMPRGTSCSPPRAVSSMRPLSIGTSGNKSDGRRTSRASTSRLREVAVAA